ncbi:MAG TPA: threonine ammonia-lyase [Thermoprotei archaeon]|nr:threonine ammonia-lyase [Thermoprotei archaeon]
MSINEPTLTDIIRARERISPYVHKTPLVRSETFSKMTENEIYLKLENFQKTGSFKVRGALNKLMTTERKDLENGVITASAGNHAQGVAYAAMTLGVKATVVMPKWASEAKVNATKSYGAEVVLYGANFDEAAEKARIMSDQLGMLYVPAFDDDHVIAGQGTIGLEILEDEPSIDYVVVPVGGGGLISGIALACQGKAQVVGVESEAFPSIHDALMGKTPSFGNTIADGIAVKKPSQRTLTYIKKYVKDITLVRDDEIAKAVFLLMERQKIIAEPAGAVGLAALLSGDLKLSGKRVVVLISGGNVDLHLLSRIIDHALLDMGRLLIINFVAPDRPGVLSIAVSTIAEVGGNIIHIQHERESRDVPIGYSKVKIWIEVPDPSASQEIIKKLSPIFPSVAKG